ncbi:valine--tRNA ligase [uncultured Litoreibacter sp.]|uniref:valine--tRNA ligase n=1 Tax=uncultured Litoreibacter sp. TaxID=1392394 RepID=UPI00260D9458|nr:valine--tRNA ligase [uncultured Litoreibacter sp.]
MAMEKTFNAAEAEARLSAAWEKAGCFKAGANASRSETFCIMIPPPNVTGVLHMGHAFNNTLQDILIRWHRMRGFDTLWQPGTDHAGIATQMVVERQLMETQQPKRTEMGREKFLEKVWDWKAESGGTIINQLKRLGASCDYSREAFTMSGAPGAPDGNEGNFHDAVIKVFVEMYNKGLIYRGKRLVNWDPHFETAISDLEVENIETPGHMWHFKYPLAGGETYEYVEKDEDGNVTLRETRDYISIATTRPETMLGDGAVAVHPDDARYAPIVGKLCEIPVGPKEHRRLIPIITDEYPDMTFGSGAVKITGAHDFNDYEVAKRGGIPMYSLMDTKGAMRADGKPYAEEAEAAQKIANGDVPMPDESVIAAMNLVPEAYRGLDRFEARKAVVQDITDEGLAVMHSVPVIDEEDGQESSRLEPYVESKPIMQPFGDRSKVVIEPMLTDQWFVDTSQIVQPALDAVNDGRTRIMPEGDKKVYFHWLENIEPWCISRQLWWGHQIPVWYAGDFEYINGEVVPKANQNEGFVYRDNQKMKFCAVSRCEAENLARKTVASRLGEEPENIYFFDFFSPDNAKQYEEISGETLPIDEKSGLRVTPDILLRTLIAPQKLANGRWIYTLLRDPDVLDTWFSSGLWPIGTLGWPEETEEYKKYFPTSTLITGQDILFFWVARMMMMQLAVVDEVPFDTVYLHGLVRDAKGKKMSKSTGNVVDPLDIIDEFGADALRFTNAAMASLGGVLKLDTQRIAGYRNFGTKLWNAVRFAELNECFADGARQYGVCTDGVRDVHITQTVNKWIIGETAKVRETVDAALEAYRFNDAADALYKFVWGKVCDWYVELSKPLFYDGSDAQKAETREVMSWVLDQCMIMLHPTMPFITEELWGETYKRDELLAVTDWPTYQASDLVDENADREMNWVITLIESVRSARGEMNVPASLEVPLVQVDLDDAGQTAFANNEALIKKLARLGEVSTGEAPKGSVSIPVAGGNFALPLAGIVDVSAEKARLEKSLAKLAKELGGLRGRLNNPKFVASAPDEVVAEAKENLAAREEEEGKLKAALARLAELG